jgi:hypothetical protein
MERPAAAHVDQAVTASLTVLSPATDADWQILAGDLDWTCWQTAAHIAHDLLAYASQLTAQPADAYLPVDLVVRADAPVPRVLDAVRACGGLLATALQASPPTLRAWHWGSTDPTGFAALGVNEILVHTWDIAQGLVLDWQPPAELAELVVQRLFPSAPTGDPAHVLLWSTGRIALPQHPRRDSWTLHAAMN